MSAKPKPDITPKTTITRDDLPPVDDNRFWEVKHNPKSVSTPVTIELREYLTPAAAERKFQGMSRLLGIIYTTADRDTLLKAAFTLESRVGNIDNVTGVY